MQRTRGFMNLVFDVVEENTCLIERTHDAVVERWARRVKLQIQPDTLSS